MRLSARADEVEGPGTSCAALAAARVLLATVSSSGATVFLLLVFLMAVLGPASFAPEMKKKIKISNIKLNHYIQFPVL